MEEEIMIALLEANRELPSQEEIVERFRGDFSMRLSETMSRPPVESAPAPEPEAAVEEPAPEPEAAFEEPAPEPEAAFEEPAPEPLEDPAAEEEGGDVLKEEATYDPEEEALWEPPVSREEVAPEAAEE